MSGDDLGVVERMHEREPLHVAKTLHLREQVTDVPAMEHDPRPVAEARVDLRADGALGHHDGDRHTGRRPSPRICLAGVARGQRDRAARSGIRIERQDPVRHPAHLERAGRLEVVGLEVETPARKADLLPEPFPNSGLGPARRGRGLQHRGSRDAAGDALPGSLDRGELEHVIRRIDG